MPVVHNLGQHGAPSSGISPSLHSTPRSSSSSSWLGLSSPWLCGAVLVLAVLLFRHQRGRETRSRGVSISRAETPKSTISPTQSQWSSDASLRSEKETFSSPPSSWPPTAIKHGNHASGTKATITTTTPIRSVFPYPNPPSPTLSPMEGETGDQELPSPLPNRTLPQPQNRDMSSPQSSPPATTTATAPSQLSTPPRRRSYTKTSTVPIAPTRAYTFPITADESEFRFGSGIASESDQPNPLPMMMGIELAEEVIIAAEGWRRHTRVYGGGVCQACLDSEQQQQQLGLKPIKMDA